MNNELGRIWKEADASQFKEVSLYLRGRAEEYYETLWSEYPVPEPTFDPGTYRIHRKCSNHSATKKF
jgi:hypothetical protein